VQNNSLLNLSSSLIPMQLQPVGRGWCCSAVPELLQPCLSPDAGPEVKKGQDQFGVKVVRGASIAFGLGEISA
jgi:hypothetical protein